MEGEIFTERNQSLSHVHDWHRRKYDALFLDLRMLAENLALHYHLPKPIVISLFHFLGLCLTGKSQFAQEVPRHF